MIAPAATQEVMTEPSLQINIDGECFDFVVDTSATVSFIKPAVNKAQIRKCKMEARGVSGTNLKVLGIQTIKLQIESETEVMTFIHSPVSLVMCVRMM